MAGTTPRRLFCLDLGTRTGFAIGDAGAIPTSGAVVLREPSAPGAIALANLLEFLRQQWTNDRPDLVVIEAPLPLAAMARIASNEEAMVFLHRLNGIVQAVACRFSIRLVEVAAPTARKHFIGKANAGDRDATKRAVISRCIALGYLPRGCDDDDRADALCVFDWAAATLCRVPPRELHFFNGVAP